MTTSQSNNNTMLGGGTPTSTDAATISSQHQHHQAVMTAVAGVASSTGGHSINHASFSSAPSASFSNPSPNSNNSAQIDLTEIDGGLAMLLERSRQGLASCKEAVVFLKNRAKVEEDYGKSIQKLTQSTLKSMDRSALSRIDSHHSSWQRIIEVHETLAANRMKFSITLAEMSDDLSNYVKEKEKVRRQLKETEIRYQRSIEESESALEKTRTKYEIQSNEWEKLLLKMGNGRVDGISSNSSSSKQKNVGNAMSGIFSKHKASTQELLERLEQEAGLKARLANENYKKLLNNTNSIRRDFYDVQLPKILASVMGLIEEVNECLKWCLGKYAYAYECAVLADALTLKPSNGDPGMMEMIEDIDSKSDLDNFLRATAHHNGRVDRTSIPYKEYEMSPMARTYANPKRIFGVLLDKQLERDGHQIPLIIIKCTEAVEAFGLQQEGIYRQSGQSSQVNKLRCEFNLDADAVDLRVGLNQGDINNIASVLKMYLRELPNGLIPSPHREAMLSIFGPSASDEHLNQQQQQHQQDEGSDSKVSRLKQCIRCLPPANAQTLSYLIRHLDKIQTFQEFNMMNSENLGIVFGPTILPPNNDPTSAAQDIRKSAWLVKFILDNRRHLFDQ